MKSGFQLLIDAVTERIVENCKNHGFYDKPRSFLESMALLHSEVSEAVEEDRLGSHRMYYLVKEDFQVHDAEIACNGVKGVKIEQPDYDILVAHFPDLVKVLKPMGVPAEFADIFIRLLDDCARYGVELDTATAIKMKYNETREFMHGKTV